MGKGQIFKAGSNIFHEGQDGHCAYIIEKGRIEIYIEKDETVTPISILGPGEIFGEMAIIESAPRSASARALEDCELTEVSKEQLGERVGSADPIVRLLLNMLSSRMRSDLKRRGLQSQASNKNSKVNGSTVETPSLKKVSPDNNPVIDKIRFEGELHDALKNNEFELYFQPIVNMFDHRAAGVEALIRWNSPNRGLVRPDLFMGVAEETSLIVPIGQWVMKESFRQFSEMLKLNSKQFEPFPFLSVNVSVRQFNDSYFFDVLEDCIKTYEIDPQQVKFEITERVLFEGPIASQWIRRCREMGFSVALDDFGTGYSSLNNLDSIEINYLKIDKCFVDRVITNKSTRVIVKSLIDMSKGLGLKVVAEGIETEEQFRKLRSLGADLAQGYYFARPMPLDKLFEYLLGQTTQQKAS